MSRKAENIYKRKDGRWEGRYIQYRTIDGKAKYGYIYAYSYMECKQRLISAKATPKKNFQYTEIQKDTTLQAIAEQWLEYKSSQIKPATLARYKALLKTYIFPQLGEKNIDSLTKREAQEFSHFLLSVGKRDHTGLSPKMVSDTISLLRMLVRHANENGYNISTEICNIKIKQEQKKLQILSKEAQQKLCTYLIDSTDLRDMGILVALFTGIRIGELSALKWENISLENRTIYVCSTLQRIPILRSTDHTESRKKTEVIRVTPKSICSIRTIPLPDFLADILSNIEEKQGYLLTSKQNLYIEPRSMQYHFRQVLRKNSIKEMNFHCQTYFCYALYRIGV